MNRRLLLSLLLIFLFTATALLSFKNWNTVHASSTVQSSSTPGSLLARDSSGKLAGPCPLKHTAVRAEVSGFISRVTVTQEFENPFEDKIEAVYTFPLPQAAAVDDMTMLIGERVIKGKLMRREEAQAAYAAARSSGQAASLLDQERPNIFTQSVANILPGQPIKVTISYVETLKYDEGSYEWSFPMVVGPRYIPGGAAEPVASAPDVQSERVPDAARISPPVVPDGMRPGHDISIEVTIDAGVPVESLAATTHEIEVERKDDRRAVVRLKDRQTIPNKDFILKYDVAGGRIEDALLAHRSKLGGYFTLILQPPERVTVEDVTPKELVFVLDTSGSMEGFPLNKAKETMALALDNLYPQDTFNLITFSGDTNILFKEPVAATPNNLRKAKKFLASQDGGGGTEMMKAIRAALKPSDSQSHVRIACFMTDGQVGNDMEIIGEVQKYKNARVFAMGFGSSPNRFLLDKMAEYGRGEVEYVTEGGDTKDVARRFHERVRSPLLTDISVEWSGVSVSEVYPKLVPDLFSARPVILSGRYGAGGQGTVRLRGKMSGRDFVRDIPFNFPEQEPQHDVLATLWARARIDDLMGEDMKALQLGQVSDKLREAITQLGLEYRLMTQFTSFVAIEDTVAADEGEPRRVDVPVAAPANSPSSVVSTQPGMIAGTNIPGSISETVYVTSGGAATLNTTDATMGNIVEVRTIENLPLMGRSPQALIGLTPGTVAGGASGSSSSSLYSVNGQRTTSNNFIVDGVSANAGIAPGGQDPGASAAGTTPGLTATGGVNGLSSIGATQEFSVRTYSMDAGTGRTPGAEVEIITRSGTNEFHGALFEYFGNDALDAGDWFANSRRLRQPARRLNAFGGNFGGPLKKDKTFFFASYEGLRLRQPVAALTDVPSFNVRALAPASLQPFLMAYPLPNGAERGNGFAEFASAYANPARMDTGSFRLDHMLNDNLRGYARYSFTDSEAEERGANGSSLNTLNRRRNRLQTITGSATYAFSPTILGELKANYSRFTSGNDYVLDNFGGASVSPASDFFASFFSSGNSSAAFDLAGRNAALMTGGDVTSTQRQLNTIGSVNIVNGNHSLKFGADYRRLSPVIGLHPFEQGVLFNGAEQTLTGISTRTGAYTRTTPQYPVFHNLSLYGQDEWKLSSRLTLVYGLRWELNPPPSESYGRDALAVNQVDDLAQLSLAPRGTGLWKTTYNNFAPRVGLAYEVSRLDDYQLVLRGGFGVFYDLGSDGAGHAYADSYPFLEGRALFNAPFVDASSIPSLAGNASAPVTTPFYAFDPQLKLPYTLKWSVTIDQAFGSNNILSMSYVGTAGRRLLVTESLFDRNTTFSFIRLTTNGAKSDYDSLQLQFNRRLSSGLQALVSYTLSKSSDDFSQDSAQRTLLRSDDAMGERGPSDFDVRHLFAGFVSYDIPSAFDKGIGYTVARNWTAITVFNARSARPLNIVYGFPTAYGSAYLRPDAVAGVPLYLDDAQAAGGRRLNPDAFIIPATLRQGTLTRNSLRGFPLYQLDFALARKFNFNERVSLQLRMEAFNLFNHPNFEDPVGADLILGNRSSAPGPLTLNTGFGQSASMSGRSLSSSTASSFSSFYQPGGPRSFQFSLKLEF